MWRRRVRQKLHAIIFSPKSFFLAALAVLILLSVPLSRNLSERYRINKEIRELEDQVKKTQNKNLELQKLIGYLGSDQYVEEQARENLGLKKEGEDVVVLKGLSNADPQASSEPASQPFLVPGLEKAQEKAEVSNPGKWLAYFFRH